MFRDGFLVALLNPKTALFYVAFLPQFMNMQGDVISQSILLGTVFVGVAACTDCMYAALAGWAAPMLRRSQSVARPAGYVTGGVFITLVVLGALGGARVRL